MSLECGECERDLRGPHAPGCIRSPEGRALIRGMAMALAETQAILCQPSIAAEVLGSWGINSARQLRAAGVEAFDIDLLRKALKETRRRRAPSPAANTATTNEKEK